MREANDERGLAPLRQVIAIARRAPRDPRAQRRGAAFEVGARPAHAVAIDHHAGIAVGHVLTKYRRHDGLVVDAGIRHQHAERFQGCNCATLQINHPRLLLEPVRGGKISAARVADGWNAKAAAIRRLARQALEPFNAGHSERFGVGHDMRLRDRNKIVGAEIIPHPDLMLDRPLRCRAELARAHRLFFLRELHQSPISTSWPGLSRPSTP